MVSGNSGSNVAWFEFARPGRPPVVVVYDAARARCSPASASTADLTTVALPYVVSDRTSTGSLDPDSFAADDTPQVRLDPHTGDRRPVSDEEYLADVRRRARPDASISDAEEDAGPPGHDGTDRNSTSPAAGSNHREASR